MHVTHAYTYPYIGSHHSKVHLILKIHLFTFDIVDDWRDQWFHSIYQYHEDHGLFLKRKWRITEQFLAMVPSPRRKKTKRPIKFWITSQTKSSERYAFNSTICDSTVTLTCFVFVVFQNNLYVILCIFILSFGWPLSIVVSSTAFCVCCGASKYHRRDSECDALLSHEKTTLNCAH